MNTDTDSLTTATYKETPYEDETYKILGAPPSEDVFVPMSVGVIRTDVARTDVMFSDFGGTAGPGNDAMWHLPQGVRYVAEEKKKNAQQQKELEHRAFEQRLEEARAEAFQLGKQEGIVEAEALLNQRTEEMNSKIGAIIQDLVKQIRERLGQIEQDAAKLAVNIVDKIIPEAVEVNPEYIIPILKEALDLAGPSIIRKVRVSPEDMEFIKVVGLQQSLSQFDGSWEFAADETIRAGCIVDTSAGEIEYDLNKAWARMKDNILKVVR